MFRRGAIRRFPGLHAKGLSPARALTHRDDASFQLEWGRGIAAPMAETILVSVGLVLVLVVVGVVLYVLVSRARAAQDRRDYGAGDRDHADAPPARVDEAAGRETPEARDRPA